MKFQRDSRVKLRYLPAPVGRRPAGHFELARATVQVLGW